MYERSHLKNIRHRIEKEPRKFIQVLYGPRQVGKTTMLRQFTQKTSMLCHFAAADSIPAGDQHWISQQWEIARLKIKQQNAAEAVLIIDEIQKINNWSEQVKKEWDSDTHNNVPLKVVILGSSRLLLQQGLTESLAGRYETTYISHWSFAEMHDAFGMDAEQYIWFGGYPGPTDFIRDENRWKKYITEALIETSISRDILMLTRVDKPALMRRLFELGCFYSGQILSYTKILGQLHDAGNTTTLAHYLYLLDTAGLLKGIEKFSPDKIRQRASSPKFQVHNTALISAQQDQNLKDIRIKPEIWGRWVESAVGAHLLNFSLQENFKVHYWRHRNDEIDFVISNTNTIVGIEVKSGKSGRRSGTEAFQKLFNPKSVFLIGDNGLPIEEFLKINPVELF